MRVYSPYQDYYEVVPPNAHETTYVRSYYGPPYVGKSLAALAPAYIPTHGLSVGTRPHPSHRDPLQGPPHPINRNSPEMRAPPHSERTSSLGRPLFTGCPAIPVPELVATPGG